MLFASCGSPSYSLEDIFEAIRSKNIQKVEQILASGDIPLDPPRVPNLINKPLAYAAAYGDLEIVKLILSKGADINGQVAYGDGPLSKAAEQGNSDIVKFLLSEGADVNNANAFGVSAFMAWCAMGDVEHVKLGLTYGGKVNEGYIDYTDQGNGKKNWTPMQASAAYGKLEVVKILLTSGGDPTIKEPGW